MRPSASIAVNVAFSHFLAKKSRSIPSVISLEGVLSTGSDFEASPDGGLSSGCSGEDSGSTCVVL